MEHDAVNKPAHYDLGKGIDVLGVRSLLANKLQREGIVLPYEDYSDWDRAFEYLIRAPFKNGQEDYEKASFYLDRLINRMSERGNT
jgi:hypothetical protein